jgi:hypothetical protein
MINTIYKNPILEVAFTGMIDKDERSYTKSLDKEKYFVNLINKIGTKYDLKNEKIVTIEKEITLNGKTKNVKFGLKIDTDGYYKLINGEEVAFRKSKNNPQSIKVRDLFENIKKDIEKEIENFQKFHKEELEKFEKDAVETILNDKNFEDQKWLVEVVKRELDYEKAEDKETWLKENGYTGLENLDVDESWKCYGHTCGRTTMIDHKNKKVIVGGYSTDD